MLTTQTQDWAAEVTECQQLVLTYDALAHQIAKLLLANGGITRTMSDEDYCLYRHLAQRRDLVCDMIQIFENNLLDLPGADINTADVMATELTLISPCN